MSERRRSTRAWGRKGSHALEFALCLPVWLCALTVVFDLAWLGLQQTSLQAAISDACRAASFLGDGGGGPSGALYAAVVGQEAPAMVETLTGSPCTGCQVQVQVVSATPSALRCTITRPMAPLVGLALGSRTLAATHQALLPATP